MYIWWIAELSFIFFFEMDNNPTGNVQNEKWFEVVESEIELFTEKLLIYKPASLHVYNFILESLDWSKLNEDTKVKIFTISKWQGSVIVSIKGPFNTVAIFSPHKNYASVESALKTILNREDGPVLFYGVELELMEYLERKFVFSGIQLSGTENVYDSYWIPAEVAKAIKINCPNDLYIAKLEESHAATVNANWPYADEKSIYYIRNLITNKDTVGLFRKKDSILLSWALTTFCGIGMLHTPDEYRRKGYAALVMKQITNNLANLGRIPVLVTLRDNHAAKSLFTSMGFINVNNTSKYVSIAYPVAD